MLNPLFRSRRYQLNKQSVRVLQSGNPWIFRDQLSSAASVFKDGQWLALVDGTNRLLGHGIHQKEGLQGIRVLQWGPQPPTTEVLAQKVAKALKRREALRTETDAFRAIHGESDGLPGITLDVYGSVGVLQTYSSAVESLGRYVAVLARRQLALSAVIWKPTQRRADKESGSARVLYGQPPETVSFREGDQQFFTSFSGQKSGSFLDLRGLRRWLLEQDLKGKSVLNLFSYTGSLGSVAARAGAASVLNVDASAKALAFGQKHHTSESTNWVERDLFDGLSDYLVDQKYDLIVCDPPLLATKITDIATAYKSYEKLYRWSANRLDVGGRLVMCCCTARLDRKKFIGFSRRVLGPSFRFVQQLGPEVDHPVAFPEADYLKILVFEKQVEATRPVATEESIPPVLH